MTDAAGVRATGHGSGGGTGVSSEAAAVPAGAGPALAALLVAAAERHRAGDLTRAETLYRKVLKRMPDQPDALQLLATLLGTRGRFEEARKLFLRALRLRPDRPAILSNYGNLLLRSGRPEEAVEAYREALALDPEFADAAANLAGALNALGRGSEGEEAARAALERRPDLHTARANLAGALILQGRYGEARRHLETLAEEGIEAPEIWLNHGHLHLAEGRPAEAEPLFRRVLAARPGDMEARKWLGITLTHRRELEEAERLLAEYVAHDPSPSPALSMLGHLEIITGRTETGIARMRESVGRSSTGPAEYSTYVFNLNYSPVLGREEIWAAHREWDRRFASEPPCRDWPNRPETGRRLRIGFLSPDLRAHSVVFFLKPLLRHLDREQFEVFCYSNTPNPDQVSLELADLADGWRDIWLRDDGAVAERIAEDGIDLLLDLAGHTANNRMPLFAGRVAPVQVTYLGYPNTTGLSAMDARIVDAVTDGPDADRFASEKLVRLPRCFLCYEPAAYPAIAPPPVLRNGFVTFGSFNNLAKITEPVIEAWARILERVPSSRLLFKHDLYGTRPVQERLKAAFSRWGIAPERLVFLDRAPDLESHLACYAEVDIALDPWPYNGTTTTCEALWMGVPVITLPGDRHASRVGATLLRQIGFEAGIAGDLEDYVATAVSLAENADLLEGLRGFFRVETASSPLCDGPGHAAAFGAALRELWAEWCASGRIDRPLELFGDGGGAATVAGS